MIENSCFAGSSLKNGWETCQQSGFQSLFLHNGARFNHQYDGLKSLIQNFCHQHQIELSSTYLFELAPDANFSPYAPFLDLLVSLKPDPKLLDSHLNSINLHQRYKKLLKAYLLQYPLSMIEAPLRESVDFDNQAIVAAIVELLVAFLPDTPTFVAVSGIQYAGSSSWQLIQYISSLKIKKPLFLVCSFMRTFKNTHHLMEDNWGPFLNWLEDTQQVLILPSQAHSQQNFDANTETKNWHWQRSQTLTQSSTARLVSDCQQLLYFLCLDEALSACRVCEPQIEHAESTHGQKLNVELCDFKCIFGEVLYLLGDFDGAISEYDSLLEDAQLNNDNCQAARACRSLSWVYAGKSDLDLALHFSNQSIRFSELTNNSLERILARFVRFYVINRTTEAIEPEEFRALTQGLERFHQLDALIFCLRNFYLTLRFFDNTTMQDAFAACNRSIKLAKVYADDAAVAAAYQSKGILYSYLLDYRKTLRCLKISESLRMRGHDPLEMVRIWNGIGYFYILLEDIPSALSYYQKAFSSLNKVKDFAEVIASLYNLAWLYFICSRFNAATEALEKILQLTRLRKVTHFPFRTLHDIYALKGLCHFKQGNVIRAQYYLDEFKNLKFTASKTGAFLGGLLRALVSESLLKLDRAKEQFKCLPNMLSHNLQVDQRLMPIFHREHACFLVRRGDQKAFVSELEKGLALTEKFNMPVTNGVFEHLLAHPFCVEPQYPMTEITLEMDNYIEISRLEMQLERLHRRVRDVRLISTLQGMGAKYDQTSKLAAETMRLLSSISSAQFGYIHQIVDGKFSFEPLAKFGDDKYQRVAYELVMNYQSEANGLLCHNVNRPINVDSKQDLVSSVITIPLRVGALLMGNILIGTQDHELDLTRDDFELMVVIANNFAQQLQSNEQKSKLVTLSSTDSLTGLANRQAGQHKLDLELQRDQRYKHKLTLAFIDLDNFKYYNDKFGHDVGDKILIEFSQQLEDCLRSMDFAARWGGDEFIALFPETSLEDTKGIAKRIVDMVGSVGTLAYQLTASHTAMPDEKKLGCSIGLAEFYAGSDIHNTEALLKAADLALYKAKAQGKGRVEW